jgi:hypothetical protein
VEINFLASKIHKQRIQMKKMIFEEQNIGPQSAQAHSLNSMRHLVYSKSFAASFLPCGKIRAEKQMILGLNFVVQ